MVSIAYHLKYSNIPILSTPWWILGWQNREVDKIGIFFLHKTHFLFKKKSREIFQNILSNVCTNPRKVRFCFRDKKKSFQFTTNGSNVLSKATFCSQRNILTIWKKVWLFSSEKSRFWSKFSGYVGRSIAQLDTSKCFTTVNNKLWSLLAYMTYAYCCFILLERLWLLEKHVLFVLLILVRKMQIDESTLFADFTALLVSSNCTSIEIVTQVTLEDEMRWYYLRQNED